MFPELKKIVDNLPETPGCYQYFDENKNIIYVGKAKNLRRRVGSYFHGTLTSRKTQILVSKVRYIQYVVVPTEEDALLLENNLIKKYKPRYNILLKDDKTYPSVCVTDEYFPRVFKTRNTKEKLGTYYGPFSHAGMLSAMLSLIHKIYPLRRCRMSLTKASIKAEKHNVCLEYHIHNCKAPCVGKQSHEEYMQSVNEVREILKGNTRGICERLLREMQMLASEMRYEEAEEVKRKYEMALAFCEKTEVISHYSHDIDVFSISMDDNSAFVNFLHVTKGSINQAFTFEYAKQIDESQEELLSLATVEMRERYKSCAKEIVLPFEIEVELDGITVTVPQRGEKRHLLDISLSNVRQYKFDKARQAEKMNPEQRSTNLLKALQEKLHLKKLPYHIECFDNSNISGTDAVAACVVFKGAKPSKSDYRKYNIKTVIGPDDYASMEEVVRRRYHDVKDETEMPDLIIADGGKGQMEVIRRVIEDELHLCVSIAGLAKDNRHHTSELLLLKDSVINTIGIDIKSPLFQFLTRIQNEVHRYAIAFHRDKRSKHQVESALDNISGIGEKTRNVLLQAFGSVKRIREASVEDITNVIGEKKARLVKEKLH